MENEKKEESSVQPVSVQNLSGEQYKRHVAYRFRIGSIMSGKPIIENERLRFLEIDGRNIIRVNVIANVVDKFIQEGEKKYGSITLDDASGQLRVKTFGEDVIKFNELNQGDTIMLIGLLKYWKDEVYVAPEIIKKKDPSFLLIRKLELDAEAPKAVDRENLVKLKDKILSMVKDAEKDNGIEIEKMILEIKEVPAVINQEIKRLLEEGMVYEPRPGKLRYLG